MEGRRHPNQDLLSRLSQKQAGTRSTQSQGQLALKKHSFPVPALGQSWCDGTPGKSHDPLCSCATCYPRCNATKHSSA
jgi:hypothetical protein